MKLTELKSRVLGSIEYLDSHDHLNHYGEFLGDCIAYYQGSLEQELSVDYPPKTVELIVDNLSEIVADLVTVRGYGAPKGYLSVFLGLPKREAMLMKADELYGRERQIIAALPDEPIYISGGYLFYNDEYTTLHAVWSKGVIDQWLSSGR